MQDNPISSLASPAEDFCVCTRLANALRDGDFTDEQRPTLRISVDDLEVGFKERLIEVVGPEDRPRYAATKKGQAYLGL